MSDTIRVVLLAFDGFPLVALNEANTPSLWRLGLEGGFAVDGGRTALPSTTYPSFATLLTGASQGRTGIRTTAQRAGAVPGWAGGNRCQVPTIVHAALESGLRAAAVMGDQKLQLVLGLDEIERAWPPAAVVPDGTELDAHGYPTNAAVSPHVLAAAADRDLDLLFVHLNETDTLGHDLGPTAHATLACVRAADAIVGQLMAALAPDWHRTVVVVASDHDMSRRLPYPAIDPAAARDCAGLIDDWIADGCAAWLRLTPGVDAHMAISRLAALDGVEGWRWREPDVLLLLAAQGRVFAAPWIPVTGIHGSTSTERTLAIVGGGHDAVADIAASIACRSPRLRDWAPTLAGLLGIDLPNAEGIDLLEVAEVESAG
jgi:Type I phosphodiesterase / nucleotide pyrophosphatase